MRGICQDRFTQCLALACLILLISGCTPTRSGTPNRDQGLSLPISGSGIPLVLEGSFGGHGVYQFILDTGASTSVVTPQVAADLGATVRESARVVRNAEGRDLPILGRIGRQRLDLGGVGFSVDQAVIMDLSRVQGALGEQIDGIIAGSVFDRWTLVIDLPGSQVWVTEQRLSRQDPGVVPMVDQRLPIVSAEVAGREVDVLIDTGSSGSWMIPTDGLVTADRGYGERIVTLADSTGIRTREELAGTIRLGDAIFERPVIEHTEGLPRVGGRGLRDYRVWIDRRSGLVRLERAVETHLIGPIRGIGARLVRAGEVWEIRTIEPGLPASRSGLTDGERILAVDGQRVDQLDDAALAALVQRAGRIRLDVLRAGGVEQVFVPVVYIQP